MESTLAQILLQLATHGPGIGIGVVFLIMFYLERKRCTQLSDKLIELATVSIKSDIEHTHVYEANVKVLESIDRRLSHDTKR